MGHFLTIRNIFINCSQSIQLTTINIFDWFIFYLPNKETRIYEQIFKSLIEVCKSKIFDNFRPKICFVDFEQNIGKTVLTAVWPGIILFYVVVVFTSIKHVGEKPKI